MTFFKNQDKENEIKYINELLNNINQENLKSKLSNMMLYGVKKIYHYKFQFFLFKIVSFSSTSTIVFLNLFQDNQYIRFVISLLAIINSFSMFNENLFMRRDAWLKERELVENIKMECELYILSIGDYENEEEKNKLLLMKVQQLQDERFKHFVNKNLEQEKNVEKK